MISISFQCAVEKLGESFDIMCQINFYLQKNLLIMWYFCFILFKATWKATAIRFPPLFQNKLHEQGVQDGVNRIKINFELFGDLFDQVFCQFNENSIWNQDSHSQIENDETSGAEYPNENDLKDTEVNKTYAIPNFMSQILPDDGIAKGVNSFSCTKH